MPSPGYSELCDANRPRPEGERRRAGSKRCIRILLTLAPTWKDPVVPELKNRSCIFTPFDSVHASLNNP
jgi:hypothetical protein